MLTERFDEVQRERIWVLWAEARSQRAIARELGCPSQWVRRYVALTGGIRPAPRRRAVRALTVAEREEVSRGIAAGTSLRAIARELGRSASTVSREVARNGGVAAYRACTADSAAWVRARRPKASKLAEDGALRRVVEAGLAVRWSPQQIAAVLRREHPNDPDRRVSHETIYLALYVPARGALDRSLSSNLRTGRSVRRARGRPEPRGQGRLRNKIMIRDRPAEAEDRTVPGHWEGDLLFGRRPTAIATLVERSTRFTRLVALPHGYRAPEVREALARALAELPTEMRRSLAWDQGREMAEHQILAAQSGMPVYFCNPRSPWERGTNENTNGLLRQYFPKRGADLARVSQDELDAVALELNARPRQVLDWDTPSSRYARVA